MKKFLVVLMLCLGLYTGIDTLFKAERVYTIQTVTVARGDTLWGIAGLYAEGEDVREVILRICEANGLKKKSIYPGQVLKVPVRAAKDDYMLASR